MEPNLTAVAVNGLLMASSNDGLRHLRRNGTGHSRSITAAWSLYQLNVQRREHEVEGLECAVVFTFEPQQFRVEHRHLQGGVVLLALGIGVRMSVRRRRAFGLDLADVISGDASPCYGYSEWRVEEVRRKRRIRCVP